ncbi:hypothetical protein GBAR_LOCUS22651, partial [Geodia barretti]
LSHTPERRSKASQHVVSTVYIFSVSWFHCLSSKPLRRTQSTMLHKCTGNFKFQLFSSEMELAIYTAAIKTKSLSFTWPLFLIATIVPNPWISPSLSSSSEAAVRSKSWMAVPSQLVGFVFLEDTFASKN